jgi:hypothetical protein
VYALLLGRQVEGNHQWFMPDRADLGGDLVQIGLASCAEHEAGAVRRAP